MVHCFIRSSEDKRILSENLALEPLASPSPSDLYVESGDDSGKDNERFVPVKTKRRPSSKERLDLAATKALTLIEEAVQNDPTKELMSFIKEEMEKSREHELKLFQLLLSHRYQASFNGTPYSRNEHAYSSNDSPYPSWHSGAQAASIQSSRSMPEWSLGASYPNLIGLHQSPFGPSQIT